MIEPALALVEFSSIAAGLQAADAMVKRAPIEVLKAGRSSRASTWCSSAG